jgi:hypothetical protein
MDIIDRLRGPSPSIMAMRDAANEIEQLRSLWQAAVDDKHAWAAREVQAEREVCAKIADESAAKDRAADKSYGGSQDDATLRDCAITAECIAADIRARTKK